MSRRFWFHRDDSLKPWICLELAAKVPGLTDDIQFFRSIQEFIASKAHTAYRVDEVEADGTKVRYGGGLIAGYKLPFSGELTFGVEAAWFRDDDAEAHSFVWHMILNEAVDAGFGSVCVKPETTTHPPRMPQREHRWSDFGVHRNAHTLLRAPKPGLWSAFLGPNPGKPHFVDCLRVVRRIEIDVRGTVYEGDGFLYRGEGRVDSGPYVGCKTLEDVARQAFAQGFSTRGAGNFSGTLLEQIRHQGYIPSPTVSLTASAEVAAHYATERGKRDRALVFVMAPTQMRQSGAIWDSFASMTHRAGSVWLATDFDIVVKLVSGLGHLQEAGRVLEGLATGLNRYAKERYDTMSLEIQASNFVDPRAWKSALSVVKEDELGQILQVIELYLTIHETEEGTVCSSPYASAFVTVQQELVAALANAKEKKGVTLDGTRPSLGTLPRPAETRSFFQQVPFPVSTSSKSG